MTKGLVHVRIDDRLIHGQVAVYWCNAVNATRIMWRMMPCMKMMFKKQRYV